MVRHGETEWNREHRLQGRSDSPLTQTGVEQAHVLGATLKALVSGGSVVLHTSPLGRASRTASIIGAELGVEPNLTADLSELDQGSWTGRTIDEIERLYPELRLQRAQDPWHFSPPLGESLAQSNGRAQAWLESLPADATVVAVSHGMFSRAIRSAYLDLNPQEALDLPRLHHTDILKLEAGKITNV